MSDIKNTFTENKFLQILNNLKSKLSKTEEDYDGMDLQDYGLSDEDMAGLSVTDEPLDEDDEAARWLREQEEGTGSQEENTQESEEGQKESQPKEKKKVKRGSFKDWEPHGEYTDDQQSKMDELMDQGYSHREAERMAGAHKGPTDFQSALKHNIWPSQMSDKHLGDLKEIASHWLDNKERLDKLEADPERSPLKHAAGQAMKAHEEATKDYSQALNEFLQSDEVKDLKGRKRFQAIKEWKNNWKEQNPDYHDKLAEAGVHESFKEAGSVGGGPAGASSGSGRSGRMGENINDRIDRIAGVGMGGTMSSEEAAQHVGGIKTESGTQASSVRDPLAGGAIHPKQRQLAQQERHAKVQQLLQQHGKPEQLDRFIRLRSAKAAQGGGQKGEE